MALEAVDIHAIPNVSDLGLHPLRGVLHKVLASQIERLVVHPHEPRIDATGYVRRVRRRH